VLASSVTACCRCFVPEGDNGAPSLHHVTE
jgi:hypothetical protein